MHPQQYDGVVPYYDEDVEKMRWRRMKGCFIPNAEDVHNIGFVDPPAADDASISSISNSSTSSSSSSPSSSSPERILEKKNC